MFVCVCVCECGNVTYLLHTLYKYNIYTDLVENDINALMKEPTKKLKSNLTYKEHVAMEELAKRKDLIIINADKGGGVVIMDTDSYIKEASWQLSDKTSYKQITQDPTLQHNRMVNQTIERFKNYFLKKLQMV